MRRTETRKRTTKVDSALLPEKKTKVARALLPDKKKHRRKLAPKITGVVDPSMTYTYEGIARAAGLGRDAIQQGVEAGVIHPIIRGRRLFLSGREICRWLSGFEPVAVAPTALTVIPNQPIHEAFIQCSTSFQDVIPNISNLGTPARGHYNVSRALLPDDKKNDDQNKSRVPDEPGLQASTADNRQSLDDSASVCGQAHDGRRRNALITSEYAKVLHKQHQVFKALSSCGGVQ